MEYSKQLTKLGTETAFAVSAKARAWAEKGNKVYPFQKKRTFLQIFSKQQKRAIRKYIKSNGINFRDLSDEELKQLTAFVERIEY